MKLYPWTLHKAGGLTKTVQDEAEKAAAEADGWAVAPPDQQPPDAAPASDPEPEPDAKPRRRR